MKASPGSNCSPTGWRQRREMVHEAFKSAAEDLGELADKYQASPPPRRPALQPASQQPQPSPATTQPRQRVNARTPLRQGTERPIASGPISLTPPRTPTSARTPARRSESWPTVPLAHPPEPVDWAPAREPPPVGEQRLAAIEGQLRRKEAALRALEVQLERSRTGRSVGSARGEVSPAAQLATLRREVAVLCAERDGARQQLDTGSEGAAAAAARAAAAREAQHQARPQARREERAPPPQGTPTAGAPGVAAAPVAVAPAPAEPSSDGAASAAASAPPSRRPRSADGGQADHGARRAWREHEEELAEMRRRGAERAAAARGGSLGSSRAASARDEADERRRQRQAAAAVAAQQAQAELRELKDGAGSRVGARAPTGAASAHRHDARALGDEVQQQRAQAWAAREASLRALRAASAPRVRHAQVHSAGVRAALAAKPMHALQRGDGGRRPASARAWR